MSVVYAVRQQHFFREFCLSVCDLLKWPNGVRGLNVRDLLGY